MAPLTVLLPHTSIWPFPVTAGLKRATLPLSSAQMPSPGSLLSRRPTSCLLGQDALRSPSGFGLQSLSWGLPLRGKPGLEGAAPQLWAGPSQGPLPEAETWPTGLLHCWPSTRAVIQTPVSGLLPRPLNPRDGAGPDLPTQPWPLCASSRTGCWWPRGDTQPGAERWEEGRQLHPRALQGTVPPSSSFTAAPAPERAAESLPTSGGSGCGQGPTAAQGVDRGPRRLRVWTGAQGAGFLLLPSLAGAAWPLRAPTAASRTALAPKGPLSRCQGWGRP